MNHAGNRKDEVIRVVGDHERVPLCGDNGCFPMSELHLEKEPIGINAHHETLDRSMGILLKCTDHHYACVVRQETLGYS